MSHLFYRNTTNSSKKLNVNRTELYRTKLACNKTPYSKPFICDDRQLTTIRNAPSSVIMENYLAPCDTTVARLHTQGWLVGWFCFTSHRQLGHLEMAPPLTVHCEDVKLGFYIVPTGNRTPGRRVVVHYTTAAQGQLHYTHTKQRN